MVGAGPQGGLKVLLDNTLGLALDAAPWLLLGLAVAGLIKAWVPERFLGRWLGGRGVWPVLRAALVGAPLPLCSCGAIPLGLALYRGGASRGSATAFMVGTPGVGVDSIAMTYALLGPLLAVIRPLAAMVSAVVTGLLVGLRDGRPPPVVVPQRLAPMPAVAPAPSCDPDCSRRGPASDHRPGLRRRLAAGLRYSFTEVLDDISWWLLLGLLLAGLLLTLLPPGLLAQYASGPPAMLLLALVGIPMYLCAQAVTPVAAALIIAGVSPGTALVLLLAGPITSIATLTVLRQEFGFRPVAFYVLGVAGSAILCGLATDLLITAFSIDVPAQIGASREVLPAAVKYPSLAILLLLAWRPARRRLAKHLFA